MRSILEQAIMHVINDNHEKADELFHQFLVARTRSIHESLRQGDDAYLEDDFDDNMTTEEYFTEDDLSSVEDDFGGDAEVEGDLEGAEGDMESAEGELEDASDELDDMGMEDEAGEVTATEERLDHLEDQMDQLLADFEKIVGDDDGSDFSDDDFEPEAEGEEEVADGEDEIADGEDEVADGEEEVTDGENEEEEPVSEGEEEDEDDDFDNITESVLAELDKITSPSNVDGETVGAGGKISQNNNSALPQKKIGQRGWGEPVVTKSENHTGYDMETPPSVKDVNIKARNTIKGNVATSRPKVSAPTNKDGEGVGNGEKIAQNHDSVLPNGRSKLPEGRAKKPAAKKPVAKK